MNTPIPANSNDRAVAILTPVLALFTSFVGPLIIYLVKNSEGDSAALRSARESLNFQITVAIAVFVCIMTIWLILPLFLIWVIEVTNFILCIVHAVKASADQDYRYPFSWRLIKN